MKSSDIVAEIKRLVEVHNLKVQLLAKKYGLDKGALEIKPRDTIAMNKEQLLAELHRIEKETGLRSPCRGVAH
tara:strand:- start:103 stop:321 length:219 start_codon:yes stop_codon:yes gene_type:complete